VNRTSPAPATPTLETGVLGPREREGLLLRADSDETLAWDLANEITSTACTWMEERGGWWIDASYFDTTVDIVLRSFGSVLVLDGDRGDRLLSRDGRVEVQERLL
jgi:hypothetical protein